MGVRFVLLNVFFVGIYLLLGFKLFDIQIENSDYYIQRAQAQTAYNEAGELTRGGIYFTDRDGNEVPAVINRDYPLIYADPHQISDPAGEAALLAGEFGLDKDALQKRLEDKSLVYVLIKEKASDAETSWVTENAPKGVAIVDESGRYYQFGDLAARTLGFVGTNENAPQPTGLYGLEKIYNPTLMQGEPLQTTLDRNVQAEAEDVLKTLVTDYQATGAAIIVEEAKTGKIRALAQEPSFDPNEYASYPISDFSDPAVQSLYEPGSVFKPFTMSAGIDLGILTPETTYVDKGYLTLNGETIRNWDLKAHGKITMTNVIEYSVNTGAAFAAQQIGRKNLLDYFEKFGFNSLTGVDLPDEITGNLINLSKNNFEDIDLATAGFGQGVSVTPMELVTAYDALANGGVMMRPYLNTALKPTAMRRVMSSTTAAEVLEMMESAVDKAGVASIRGYRIAGKTGTAQVPDLVHGGYADQYIESFIGIFPVSDPHFIVLLKLDKPNQELAALTVVPAFRNFAQFLINYYNIPPDNLP